MTIVAAGVNDFSTVAEQSLERLAFERQRGIKLGGHFFGTRIRKDWKIGDSRKVVRHQRGRSLRKISQPFRIHVQGSPISLSGAILVSLWGWIFQVRCSLADRYHLSPSMRIVRLTRYHRSFPA